MNKDEIRHKCGYCGWLFQFSTNFIEHECFDHFNEQEDRIVIDENYVVTIHNPMPQEKPICKDTVDELLIGAVQTRRALYDSSTAALERTNLKKNAMWAEVSNILGGALSAEEAKGRWKYLRDNYIKARKKVKTYAPSGSAAKSASDMTPKFKFYNIMTFLNDSLQTRPTVSSMPDGVLESGEQVSSQQQDDALLYPEPIVTPLLPTPIRVPRRTPTPTDVRSPTQTVSRSPTPTLPAKNSKRQKSDDLQAALLEALKEPAAPVTDPLDGFLARLGEGMRKLPYRARAQLEIKFLTLLAETEDCYGNGD